MYADEEILRRGGIFTRKYWCGVLFDGPDGDCAATLAVAYLGRRRNYVGTVSCCCQWRGDDDKCVWV